MPYEGDYTQEEYAQQMIDEYKKAGVLPRKVGLNIITWTLERSGPLVSGGGWYHQTITPAINNDGDTYELLDVLAQRVGILGIFSDWPATVTFYANCMSLK
jgi:glycerophosphoryl diester phosphodiesterase